MRKMVFAAFALGAFASLNGVPTQAAPSAVRVQIATSPAAVIPADYLHNHHRWHHRRRYHGRWQYWD